MSQYQDFDGLISLLKVAEELLFSFPLPNEVITKYEFIRAKTFAKSQIPYNGSHIKRLQLEALSKLDKDSEKVVHTSNLDFKDLDLQSKIQSSALATEKLLNLQEKSLKFYQHIVSSCALILAPDDKNAKKLKKIIESPYKSYSSSDLDFNTVLESYKTAVNQAQDDVQYKLEAIYDLVRTKNNFLKKLESDLEASTNEINRDRNETKENYESLKNKYFRERSEWEKRIKDLREEILLSKSTNLNETRKLQNREIEKLMQERDFYKDQADKLKNQLEEVTSNLQDEIKIIKEDYEKALQELSQTLLLKNRDIEVSLKQKIETLEKTLFFKEKELLEELEKSQNQTSSQISQLEKDLKFYKNNSDALDNIIESIHSVVSKVYRRYSDKTENFGDLRTGLLHQIEFLNTVLEKLTIDNNWLVDRLSELGKENENIKKNIKAAAVQEAMAEIETSNSVLRNFEASREKLKQKLSESSGQFPNTYLKLAHKYSNNSN